MDFSSQYSSLSNVIFFCLWCTGCSSHFFHFASCFPFPCPTPSLVLSFSSSFVFSFGGVFSPLTFCLSCTIYLLPLYGSPLSPKVPYFPLPMFYLHCSLLKDDRYVQKPNSWLGLPCATHPLTHILHFITLQNVLILWNWNTVDKKTVLIDCPFQNIR